VPRIPTRIPINYLLNFIVGINVDSNILGQSWWYKNGTTKYTKRTIQRYFKIDAIF
jgi:hypothetical protein